MKVDVCGERARSKLAFVRLRQYECMIAEIDDGEVCAKNVVVYFGFVAFLFFEQLWQDERTVVSMQYRMVTLDVGSLRNNGEKYRRQNLK